MEEQIGIIGAGVVGGTLGVVLSARYDVKYLDPAKGLHDDLTQCEVVFVCVPTPWEDDHIDLNPLRDAMMAIPGEKIVGVRSTVPIGTTDALQKEYPQHRLFFVPEFLSEDTAMDDTTSPVRTVIGCSKRPGRDFDRDGAAAIERMLPRSHIVILTRALDAEAIKLATNTFYALKVAHFNQLYDSLQKLGVDYDLVRQALAVDPWIGPQHTVIHHKGYRGFGGKCLPKDARAMLSLSNDSMSILREAILYNDRLRGSAD